MDVFPTMQAEGFEGLWIRHNKDVGLRMAVAIHDRTLGEALGGIRFYPYPSEEAMISDVMRLARGMTYKNAIVYRLSKGRLHHGGGKAVIWGDPKTDKTEGLLLAAAEIIHELNGEYIGGEDMGMNVEDIEIMRQKTPFLVGVQETHYRGGTKGSGDPSPVTALGTFEGLRSCLRVVFGIDTLMPRTFAIQGLGNVGMNLLKYLAIRGNPAHITVTDTREELISQAQFAYPGIRTISPEETDQIYDVECDVFVPCAMGGIINDDTITRLKCKIVAGCANNQLLEARHGEELWSRKILYAPDYIINAGGAINVAFELEAGGHNLTKATAVTEQIGPLLTNIFEEANERNIPPERIADEHAEKVIENARNAKGF